mmetsp:Transcript_33681/g.108249  ORF Transcript_33681/g.108249 Transcript_33681/m.108249 type:complete len:267 (+) Transcript_33681:212-1012(+)
MQRVHLGVARVRRARHLYRTAKAHGDWRAVGHRQIAAAPVHEYRRLRRPRQPLHQPERVEGGGEGARVAHRVDGHDRPARPQGELREPLARAQVHDLLGGVLREAKDARNAVGDDAGASARRKSLCDVAGRGRDAAEKGEVAQEGREEDHAGGDTHEGRRGAGVDGRDGQQVGEGKHSMRRSATDKWCDRLSVLSIVARPEPAVAEVSVEREREARACQRRGDVRQRVRGERESGGQPVYAGGPRAEHNAGDAASHEHHGPAHHDA